MTDSIKRLSKRKIETILKEVSDDSKLLTFLKKVRVIDKGCWIISDDWSEYAHYDKQRAHRYIYQIFHPDESIEELFICHKCDRPGCVNPDHLFRGTRSDNVGDAITKKRIPWLRGKSSGSVSLKKLRGEERERKVSSLFELKQSWRSE